MTFVAPRNFISISMVTLLPSACPTVCPMLTVNLKVEKIIMFKLIGEVIHIRAIMRESRISCPDGSYLFLYVLVVDSTKVLCPENLFSRNSQRYKGRMSHYVDIQHLCSRH